MAVINSNALSRPTGEAGLSDDFSTTRPGTPGSAGATLSLVSAVAQLNVLLSNLLANLDAPAGSDATTLRSRHSADAVRADTAGALVIAAPASTVVSLGVATAVPGISIADAAAVSGETFSVTLSDGAGMLSAVGSGITGDDSNNLTITGSLGQVNSDLASLSDSDGSAANDAITITASDSVGDTAAPASVAVSVAETFTFTSGVDKFTGGPGPDTFVAAAGTLSNGDVATGGQSTNTLELAGGGTFNLQFPTTLANIQLVTVTEGAGTAKPIVDLRNGLNVTVDVASGGAGAVITINGANDSSVINLGDGTDTVNVGSASETINGGSGADTFVVGPSTIGATINGGTGASLLLFTGGVGTMGANITNIQSVRLKAQSTFTANADTGLTVPGEITVIPPGGGPGVLTPYDQLTPDVVADQEATDFSISGNNQNVFNGNTMIAGGAYQMLDAGIGDTLVGSLAGSDIFNGAISVLSGDTIENFGAPNDVIVVTSFEGVGATVSYASGALTIANGSQSVAINLPGSFNPAGFHVLVDFDSGDPNQDDNGSDPVGDDAAMVVYNAPPGPGAPAPLITTPGPSSAAVGAATPLGGINVADADAIEADETLSVTITDKLGTITSTMPFAGGNEVVKDGPNGLILNGALDQINHYLSTLSYVSTTPGVDTVTVSVTDSNGGEATASFQVNVGAIPPPVVTITSAGGVTDDPVQTISGSVDTADAGTTVTVYDGTTALGVATVQPNGSWTTSVTLSGDGVHALVAKDTNSAGVGVSNSVQYTLDTSAPVIAAPTGLIVGQGQPSTLTGISLSESAGLTGETFTLAISDGAGVLTDSAAGVTGSGGHNLSIKGSLSQVNAALGLLQVTDATAGTDTITLSASESNGAVDGPVSIGVVVNGQPAITAPASATVNHNAASAITGISVAESGSTAGETFSATLSDASGLLSATGFTGYGTTSISIIGVSLSTLNTDLASLTDTAPGAGADTIDISVSDSLGNSATPASIGVSVNGAPAITAPAGATLGVGWAGAIGGISVAESGSTAGETFSATLSDASGLLSATGFTGYGTTSISIIGVSLSTLNTDLASLTDTAPGAGADTIDISVSDSLGNSATPASIGVSVNGAPAITAPAGATLGVGWAGTIGGISVAESGSTAGETFSATLSDASGLLSATGFTGYGTTSISIIGVSLSTLNTDLASLTDTAPGAGADTIDISVSDSLGNSATPASIGVSVNGAPAITAPAGATLGVGWAGAIGGISVAESGSTAGETFSATLSDASGLLSATGFTGYGTTSISIIGVSLSTLNTDLASLTDTAPGAGADTIDISVSDSLGNSATPASIGVSVNGAPAITAPAGATVTQSTTSAITGVSLSETGATGGETFTVTVSDQAGDLSATGTGVAGSGTNDLTIVGSLAQVNADLATLTDTDASTAADTITLTASDSFGNNAAGQTIAISVTVGAETFRFTTGVDHFVGGPGANIFIATAGTLSLGDTATGGGLSDVLELQGAGTFNLGLATLSGIPIVTAQEGQPASSHIAGQNQTVDLANGMNAVTISVAAATLNPRNPNAATITIVGANNNDVINLASGNDVVTVGSAAEVVNGGSGVDTINVTAATIGASINGGSSGKSVLVVSGGGTLVMGANITGVGTVNLAASTSPYIFTANAIAGLVVDDMSAASDTIAAGAAGQILKGGAAGKETFVGFGSGATTYQDAASTLNGDTIENYSSGDAIDITGLSFNPSGRRATKVTFVATNATEGVLTVMDGSKVEAKVTLFHQAALGSFTVQSDGTGGTLILDPGIHSQPSHAPHLAQGAQA